MLTCLLALTALAADPVILVHDTPEPMETLAAGLRRHGIAAVLEDQATFRKRLPDVRAKAVINYVHNQFDEDIELGMIRYTDAGGRMVVLHHGMASGKMRSKHWPDFMGIRILPRDHPTQAWKVHRGRFTMVNRKAGHFVTSHRVKSPIVLSDTEIFHNQIFTDGDRKTVLFGMKGETNEGLLIEQDTAGWMMPRGRGHIFYFQPGHFARDFENQDFVQVIVNAIEWK